MKPTSAGHLLPSLLLLVVALASCTWFASEKKERAAEVEPLQSVIVLPTETMVDSTPDISYEKARQLAAGAEALDRLLADYFEGSENVRLISETQKEALAADFIGSRAGVVRAIGQRAGSDGVLIVTVNRFIERRGTDYSAEQPASVAFDYKLLAVKSGRILCSGFFDQTQQGLFENLLSFSGAMKRKFKWITAEELAREGIAERFATCPHLQRP